MQLTNSTIDLAIKAAKTAPTARNYSACLHRLMAWLDGRELGYALLLDFRAHLVRNEYSPQNTNQHLAAARFFIREMALNGLMAAEAAEAICSVKNREIRGRKLGNWLSIKEAETLLNKPDTSTPMGLRDRAILGLMIGGGLRRSEICGLQVKHFEKREGRWMLIGVAGKHGRTRNIPIADWVKAMVDVWTERAKIKTGYIFVAAWWHEGKKRLTLGDAALTPAALFHIVKRYGKGAQLSQIAPHDLRRTFARLGYEGGADMKQIQLALGHKKQETTEDYVNAKQDFQSSPSDLLGINVEV